MSRPSAVFGLLRPTAQEDENQRDKSDDKSNVHESQIRLGAHLEVVALGSGRACGEVAEVVTANLLEFDSEGLGTRKTCQHQRDPIQAKMK
jgi:hypothetical protein